MAGGVQRLHALPEVLQRRQRRLQRAGQGLHFGQRRARRAALPAQRPLRSPGAPRNPRRFRRFGAPRRPGRSISSNEASVRTAFCAAWAAAPAAVPTRVTARAAVLAVRVVCPPSTALRRPVFSAAPRASAPSDPSAGLSAACTGAAAACTARGQRLQRHAGVCAPGGRRIQRAAQFPQGRPQRPRLPGCPLGGRLVKRQCLCHGSP